MAKRESFMSGGLLGDFLNAGFAGAFIIFPGGDVFDFDDFFEHITELSMMDEAEILHIGEVIAEIAGMIENIEEILSLSGRVRCAGARSLAEGGVILELVTNRAGMGTSVGVVEITRQNIISVKDHLMY